MLSFPTKKIHVIHIISGDLWAGAEAQVFHTLCNLSPDPGLSFTAILFNNGILATKLREHGIKCIILDESKNNAIQMLRALTKLLRHLKPRILHVHGYKEQILGKIACTLNNNDAKIVRTFHGMSEVPKGLPFVKKIKSHIVHKTEELLMRNCNIIAVSKDLERFLASSFPMASVTHIYNGIPLDEKNTLSKETTRGKYGVEDYTFWIGSVARLEEVKNLGMLIQAGKKLRAMGVNFRISIFGVGPQKVVLQRQIEENSLHKFIKLEGFVQDIMPVLGAIDVFVLCSIHEGLPMSLLEAIFIGTPVACSNVGGIKELISDNHSGLLFPVNDVSALCHAILKLKRDANLRHKLTENANRTVFQAYSIENTNKNLLALYRTIA